MTFFASAVALSLVVCHGGPADHFATFAESLPNSIEIYATGPALKKFQEKGVPVKVPFSLDHLTSEEENVLAEQIAHDCSQADVVMTDLGHPFDIKVQQALARIAPQVHRLSYYDNPEKYVPGGYSAVAAEVIEESHAVLFANAGLAEAPIFQTPDKEIDFGHRKKIGIGYYPIHTSETIAKRRISEKSFLRHSFFQKNDLKDSGQPLLVYFGGNNEEYYSKALPAFISLLQQAESDAIIVLQQHPGAKIKNRDKVLCEQQRVKIFLSDFSPDEAQIIADGALYYQTSMAPQFVLAGIPTIQIGHETYDDILVRNHLCPSVTTVTEFIEAIKELKKEPKAIPEQILYEGLGIKTDWLQNLEAGLL